MATTPRTRPRRVTLDPEVAARISALEHNPAFQELRNVVATMREQYFTEMANRLALNRTPVDQRAIDEKRGYWDGAIWVVDRLIAQAEKEFEAFIAEQTREADRT